jgi:hypothetical protein
MQIEASALPHDFLTCLRQLAKLPRSPILNPYPL